MTIVRRQHGKKKRRGLAAMELALVLPVLGVLMFGMFEFAILFYARSTVVEACRTGCRAAARRGVDEEQVLQEVRRVLSPSLQNGVQVGVIPGERSGDAVTVAVRVPMRAACPDLLWVIGYSLQGRYLISEATMIKE